MNSPVTTLTYRIALVDDHAILREGLKKLISEDPDLVVVDEAKNGEDLLEKLSSHSLDCDLIILDISMPGMDGLRIVERIKEDWPNLKILILTMHDNREYFKQAVSLGIDGYMLKEDVYESMISAIKRIRADERAYSPRLSSHLLDDMVREIEDGTPSLDVLTRREREILSHVARGMTSKRIAEILNISSRTVESHRARIMEKLKIRNVAGLVQFALKKNLV